MIRNIAPPASPNHVAAHTSNSTVDRELLGVFMGCLFRLRPKDRRYGSLVGVTSAAPGEGVSTMA